MRVKKVEPVNGVKVYVEGDCAIYMRTESEIMPIWYEPDMATLSLKILSTYGDKYDELEAAYQDYIDTYAS